jgi:hypothetical protein
VNSGNNGFDFNKGNIFKPNFDTMAFEAYITDLRELFLSRGEVTR